jgi:hypothetical protein
VSTFKTRRQRGPGPHRTQEARREIGQGNLTGVGRREKSFGDSE